MGASLHDCFHNCNVGGEMAEPGTTSIEERLAEAIAKYSNWGRWGADDALGTLNFIDDAKRAEAATLVRRGVSFSLAIPLGVDGPQNGLYGRMNPIHTMTRSGLDAAYGLTTRAHGMAGADDLIVMTLQSGTQWDGLGHIFSNGKAWNGRDAAAAVTSTGDHVTGMERIPDQIVGRGVLLDVGRLRGQDGELPAGYAITEKDIRDTIEAQGASSAVGRGDIVLVRTGQLGSRGPGHWGDYIGGDAPGMSFTTLGWLHDTEIAAIATDTSAFEVMPGDYPDGFSPMHQIVIPYIGMMIGEIWNLEELARDCAADGCYEFLLCAPVLPVVGAVGTPTNPIVLK